MSNKCVVGIDLGGTKILTAVADLKGKILTQVRIDTEAKRGQTVVIGNIINSVVIALKKSNHTLKDVKNICIGAPGPIIFKKGIIVSPPNLPGWGEVDLKKRLEKVFRKPVLLDNDANLAALAEAKKGAGRGKKNVIYLTISTGIGAGIVLDGKVFRGSIGGAGEIGHTIIQKSIGKNGSMELLGSGTAIATQAMKAVKKNSLILKLAKNKRLDITAEIVAKAARKGDRLARQIINDAGESIGIGVANIVNIFNPDVVTIGGGVSEMNDLIFNPIKRTVHKYALKVPRTGVNIVKAKMGSKAGIEGAVLGCFEQE